MLFPNGLHRKPRWWRSDSLSRPKNVGLNSLRKVPINVKPEGGMEVRATHRNLIVKSEPWVGILIVRDVPGRHLEKPRESHLPSCKYLDVTGKQRGLCPEISGKHVR